ncbi:MAG TPA: adenine deaminase, partial [Desulfobacteraceae bacterium]|nr:adenine deaminase [Desulfobacteraceae bacterium]
MKPDIFLKGGTVLNVYSGELLEMNVVARGERIWYVGPRNDAAGQDALTVDATGKVLVPGYIDPHFHPWFVYNPLTFGEMACALGTTTLFCDNLLFYLLMGPDLFQRFMESLSDMPVKYFWFCRAVPQTPMACENDLFSIENLEKLLRHPLVQSLGEITRWHELIKGNPKIMEIIRIARGLGKRVDGHTAGARYDQLNDISRGGVASCHEAITAQEVLDRLRLGLYVFLRESSLRQDLSDLLKVVTRDRVSTKRIMLTSDSSSPAFYQEFGVTDHILEIALREGIDPIRAYQMVTITPAVYYGMDQEVGGIAPGRYADILILKDLLHPTPETVISRGRLVARQGRLIAPFPQIDWDRFFPPGSFVKGNWSAKRDLFQIAASENRIRFPVIKLISAVITRTEWIEFDVQGGRLDLGAREGFLFLTLLHKERRWATNGVIHGFGNRVEGLAASFNTAAEILVTGRKPEAMAAAVNRMLKIKGGIVAVENGKIAFEFPLPLGGIMSNAPVDRAAEKERDLKTFLSRRGYPFHDPLYTLVFLPNDFLPDVRIN